MGLIKLDNEYYVTADTRSFVLNRKYKPEAPKKSDLKPRETTESVVGYYSNIAHLLNAYRKEQMLKWVDGEKLTLEQLCDRINEMDATLTKKLSKLQQMDLGDDAKQRRRGKNENAEQTAS